MRVSFPVCYHPATPLFKEARLTVEQIWNALSVELSEKNVHTGPLNEQASQKIVPPTAWTLNPAFFKCISSDTYFAFSFKQSESQIPLLPRALRKGKKKKKKVLAERGEQGKHETQTRRSSLKVAFHPQSSPRSPPTLCTHRHPPPPRTPPWWMGRRVGVLHDPTNQNKQEQY